MNFKTLILIDMNRTSSRIDSNLYKTAFSTAATIVGVLFLVILALELGLGRERTVILVAFTLVALRMVGGIYRGLYYPIITMTIHYLFLLTAWFAMVTIIQFILR